MSETGLAAVHAALEDAGEDEAAMPEPKRKPRASRQMAATPASSTPDVVMDSVAIDDARQQGHAEGARAERERILGISVHADAFPGHDALISEMQSDGVTQPDQAAGRILAAEKALRGKRMQAIAAVENETSRVSSAPLAGIDSGPPARARTAAAWEAEWARDTALQEEFASAESYIAFKKAETAGHIKIYGKA